MNFNDFFNKFNGVRKNALQALVAYFQNPDDEEARKKVESTFDVGWDVLDNLLPPLRETLIKLEKECRGGGSFNFAIDTSSGVPKVTMTSSDPFDEDDNDEDDNDDGEADDTDVESEDGSTDDDESDADCNDTLKFLRALKQAFSGSDDDSEDSEEDDASDDETVQPHAFVIQGNQAAAWLKDLQSLMDSSSTKRDFNKMRVAVHKVFDELDRLGLVEIRANDKDERAKTNSTFYPGALRASLVDLTADLRRVGLLDAEWSDDVKEDSSVPGIEQSKIKDAWEEFESWIRLLVESDTVSPELLDLIDVEFENDFWNDENDDEEEDEDEEDVEEEDEDEEDVEEEDVEEDDEDDEDDDDGDEKLDSDDEYSEFDVDVEEKSVKKWRKSQTLLFDSFFEEDDEEEDDEEDEEDENEEDDETLEKKLDAKTFDKMTSLVKQFLCDLHASGYDKAYWEKVGDNEKIEADDEIPDDGDPNGYLTICRELRKLCAKLVKVGLLDELSEDGDPIEHSAEPTEVWKVWSDFEYWIARLVGMGVFKDEWLENLDLDNLEMVLYHDDDDDETDAVPRLRELEMRILRLEKAFTYTTDKVVTSERRAKLEELRKSRYFDVDRALGQCAFNKMTDSEFEKFCKKIEDCRPLINPSAAEPASDGEGTTNHYEQGFESGYERGAREARARMIVKLLKTFNEDDLTSKKFAALRISSKEIEIAKKWLENDQEVEDRDDRLDL